MPSKAVTSKTAPSKKASSAKAPKKGSSLPRGMALLHDPLLNKGTAFTEAERARARTAGPAAATSCTPWTSRWTRVLDNYRSKQTDLERYIHLISLQDRNETLFYRVVMEHLEEMMPIIYTPDGRPGLPAVGPPLPPAARHLHLDQGPRPASLDILKNWPHEDVRVIVVTDGERILGLGDLGAGGMGIPIGKLSLYTACAGINPAQTLPITLDVGTEQRGATCATRSTWACASTRVRGEEYDAFVDEFIAAVRKVLPEGAHPVRGLRQHQRLPPARELSRQGLHLQRRHPGHGRGDARRPLLGAARHQEVAQGADDPLPRRRRGRHRHRRPHRCGHGGRGSARRKRRAAAAGSSTPRAWW